jgi:hypothetical protein
MKVLAGLLLALGLGAGGRRVRLLGRRPRQLEPGDVYFARPGGVARVPARPQIGDQITVVVDGESLSDPAVIQFAGEKLLGLEEDLILDVLAICRLTFAGRERGWINGPLPEQSGGSESVLG